MDNVSYKTLLDETPEYALKVKQYAKLLIDQKIWDSISHSSLESWLNNFKSQEEELIAALLLDGLVYRSAQQTTSLLIAALECALPFAVYNTPDAIISGLDFIKIFSSKTIDNSIKIVPVIRDADPPTKSGPSIARMYRRQLGINDDYMIWPWLIDSNVKAGVKTIVFIDDVLATGNQASDFLKGLKLERYPEVDFSYIPLLAHEDGINKLIKDHPKIKVSAVEVIDNTNCFFKIEKMAQIGDLEDLYLSVSKKHLNKRLYKGMAKGYKDLALTFSYYHATPNASLPLYWYESETFSPLVRR
ncbi:phosphoribosyltransferase-like protein [Pseudomonas oryzihabitans]|uniref:phosphoribosyltransferase-like protein n=1 Tax=Pseudomonas oryzihabitans TaxID=47885 RepID=UPI00165E494D|nr:hypothetical protein [Pseudomonas psychrotolerans]